MAAVRGRGSRAGVVRVLVGVLRGLCRAAGPPQPGDPAALPGEAGARPAEEHGEQSRTSYKFFICMAGMQASNAYVPLHIQLA